LGSGLSAWIGVVIAGSGVGVSHSLSLPSVVASLFAVATEKVVRLGVRWAMTFGRFNLCTMGGGGACLARGLAGTGSGGGLDFVAVGSEPANEWGGGGGGRGSGGGGGTAIALAAIV
jgi:hypothetical protein